MVRREKEIDKGQICVCFLFCEICQYGSRLCRDNSATLSQQQTTNFIPHVVFEANNYLFGSGLPSTHPIIRSGNSQLMEQEITPRFVRDRNLAIARVLQSHRHTLRIHLPLDHHSSVTTITTISITSSHRCRWKIRAHPPPTHQFKKENPKSKKKESLLSKRSHKLQNRTNTIRRIQKIRKQKKERNEF